MTSQKDDFWKHARNLADTVSLVKMDVLTKIAREHLPEGHWGTESGVINLTFDDGPCPHTTPWLLEALEKEGITATFFLIGSKINKHPYLVEKIAKAGHQIGNHSYLHCIMPVLPVRVIEREIDRTNLLIQDISGKSASIFRAPYGILDQRTADCLKERSMTPVYWGAVPEDWEAMGADRVAKRVMHRIQTGSMVVLHERRNISGQTIQAAKQIICKGKELGYDFAPLPEFKS